jgi:hypothetical protein
LHLKLWSKKLYSCSLIAMESYKILAVMITSIKKWNSPRMRSSCTAANLECWSNSLGILGNITTKLRHVNLSDDSIFFVTLKYQYNYPKLVV